MLFRSDIVINPVPSAPTASSPSPYCQGDVIVDLVATGSTGTLTWYTDSALTDSAGTGSPFVSGAVSDTSFWVTETLAGCEGIATQVDVIINQVPSAPSASSPSPYCGGDTIAYLTATGGGGTLYWFSDSALTDTLGSGSPFISGATATDTFYVAEVGACTGPATQVIITINPPLSIGAAGDTTICYGGSVQISATGSGGTAPYTYNWDNGLGNIASHNVSPAATTVYNVYIVDAAGCQSSVGSVTVTVNPIPVAGFNHSETDLKVDFINTSTGAVSYNWDFGDSNTDNTANPSHTYAAGGTYTVCLVAMSSQGCKLNIAKM